MQTHTKKITAGITAVMALTASFLFWTGVVDHAVKIAIESRLVEALYPIKKQKVAVKHIKITEPEETVATERTTVALDAALSFQSQSSSEAPVVQAPVIKEPAAQETDIQLPVVQESVVQEPLVQEPVEQVHEASDDLQQWGLSQSWSISIPSIGVRAPVLMPSLTYWQGHEWDLLEEQMQVGLSHGAVAYPHSVSPGEKGNIIVAGHSSPPDERAEQSAYGDLFASLPLLQLGETITIFQNGMPVQYRVEDKKIISPSQTSILEEQYDENILKLITCFPVGTTRDRMIIVAREVTEL